MDSKTIEYIANNLRAIRNTSVNEWKDLMTNNISLADNIVEVMANQQLPTNAVKQCTLKCFNYFNYKLKLL